MFKNYFKTAWRNLVKSKVFSFINIIGLTIGITVCMMIFLFVTNEFSFDNFHKDGDRIYRLMREFKNEGKTSDVAYVSGAYAPALMNDFPSDIQSTVRVNTNDNLITIGDKSFHEKKVINPDSNFFTFFTFPLIKGDPQTALQDPHSVVLTETTAKKYFGSAENAMGKTIMADKDLPLKVTGIAKDVPSDSHIQFDLVFPLDNYKDATWMTTWINNGVYTYVKLKPNVTASQVEKQLPAFVDKYMGSDIRKFGLFKYKLSLTPLKDVYFDDAALDGIKHGDKMVVYIFLSVAVLILLIECINFMNLSTIRAAERSKEVGLRKVLGALRNNLVWQFIGESLLFTTISCILAICLFFILKPVYDDLLGYTLGIPYNQWYLYAFLGGVVLVVGLLAGSYPALILSRFSPIEALKGKLKHGKGGSLFRHALVVVQFSISVFLITGTLIINKQMHNCT